MGKVIKIPVTMDLEQQALELLGSTKVIKQHDNVNVIPYLGLEIVRRYLNAEYVDKKHLQYQGKTVVVQTHTTDKSPIKGQDKIVNCCIHNKDEIVVFVDILISLEDTFPVGWILGYVANHEGEYHGTLNDIRDLKGVSNG